MEKSNCMVVGISPLVRPFNGDFEDIDNEEERLALFLAGGFACDVLLVANERFATKSTERVTTMLARY